MKIAVFSDIHDNLPRWQEALEVIKKGGIKIGICCGDVTNPDTLMVIAETFDKLYLALGNGDWQISQSEETVPKNTVIFSKIGGFELESRKIAAVHYDRLARQIANEGKYDIVFYGHTHTPWEEKIGKTTILNPGEVAGQYGPASFCIYDLATMKGQLKIIK